MSPRYIRSLAIGPKMTDNADNNESSIDRLHTFAVIPSYSLTVAVKSHEHHRTASRTCLVLFSCCCCCDRVTPSRNVFITMLGDRLNHSTRKTPQSPRESVVVAVAWNRNCSFRPNQGCIITSLEPQEHWSRSSDVCERQETVRNKEGF